MNLNEVTLTEDQLLFNEVNKNNDTIFSTEDLVSIIKAEQNNIWSKPMTAEEFVRIFGLTESTNLGKLTVQILYCPLAEKTIASKIKGREQVERKYLDFIEFKTHNPVKPYGASDKAFLKFGQFGTKLPGLRHAHITNDISVVYSISGFNPTQIKIYGLFTHDEMGTGQPMNINRQKSITKQFQNQAFKPAN